MPLLVQRPLRRLLNGNLQLPPSSRCRLHSNSGSSLYHCRTRHPLRHCSLLIQHHRQGLYRARAQLLARQVAQVVCQCRRQFKTPHFQRPSSTTMRYPLFPLPLRRHRRLRQQCKLALAAVASSDGFQSLQRSRRPQRWHHPAASSQSNAVGCCVPRVILWLRTNLQATGYATVAAAKTRPTCRASAAEIVT